MLARFRSRAGLQMGSDPRCIQYPCVDLFQATALLRHLGGGILRPFQRKESSCADFNKPTIPPEARTEIVAPSDNTKHSVEPVQTYAWPLGPLLNDLGLGNPASLLDFLLARSIGCRFQRPPPTNTHALLFLLRGELN